MTTAATTPALAHSNATTGTTTVAYHENTLRLCGMMCGMMCGQFRTLWPQPSGVTRLGNRFVAFDLDRLRCANNCFLFYGNRDLRTTE